MFSNSTMSDIYPYTTLFRSDERRDRLHHVGDEGGARIGQEAHVPVRDQFVDAQLVTVIDAHDDGGKVLFPRQRVHGLVRSEEHTSELQSRPHLVCRLLPEKK